MEMIARWIRVEDASAWRTALAAYPAADAYHDPAYVLAAGLGGESVLLEAEAITAAPSTAVADAAAPTARLALPCTIRRIPGQDILCDAESPYGYAAPLSVGAGAELWPALL